MSGSASLSTAPFTDAEKADLRRFMGFPAYGAGASGFQGWRFYQAYGLLEYRLNNLASAEFQVAREYLAQLYTLESGVWAAAANLDTDQAAVWKRNRSEVADRRSLYRMTRLELCAIFGVPAGPGLSGAAFDVVI